MLKDKKLLFLMLSLLCVIGIGVCVIVDMAIAGAVTWSKIPLFSILFGWFVVWPLFFSKHPAAMTMLAFTLAVWPFLYCLAGMSWFGVAWPLVAALCGVGLVSMWMLYGLFRFAKMSLWYKFAIVTVLLMVIASPIVNGLVDAYLGQEIRWIQHFTNVFGGIVIALALVIGGRMQRQKVK